MFWPCETRTSTCRSFATISSGLYRFLVIAVLLDVKDIPQVGPLQWGWITMKRRVAHISEREAMKLPHRRRFLQLAAGAAALPAVWRVARAQAYPSRPITMI